MTYIIILNEKEYAEEILRFGYGGVSIHTVIKILAKYYYHIYHFKKQKIVSEINSFLSKDNSSVLPSELSDLIEKTVLKSIKSPLIECNGVPITQNEILTIQSVKNKVLQRLCFTLLCLAKFHDYANPQNNHWVPESGSDIYSMANISTSSREQDLKFNTLRDMGLIAFSKKIDNLSVQVLYVDNDSDHVLFINDFRSLGNEWRLFMGEKYMRCHNCGLLVRQKNNRHMYCDTCKKNMQRQWQRNSMHGLRLSDL